MDGRLNILAVIAGMLLMQSPVWGAPLPKPTHTNKTRFRIPFKFDAPSLQRMNAREIQLYVSRDHGATWELAQTLAPEGGKFEYQAPTDGEFWFSVKTVDGRNQQHPPRGSYETGLIVVVDKTAPSLDLLLEQVSDGKAQLTWKAADSNLDTRSLRLEVLAAGAPDWEPISIVPQSSGETSWPVSQTGVVAVRGTVSDLAGNVSQARQEASVTAVGGRAIKPRHRGPIAENSDDNGTNSISRESLSVSLPSVPMPDEQEYQGPIITPMGRLPQYSHARADSHSKAGSLSNREQWSHAAMTSDAIPVTTALLDSARGVQTTNNVAPLQAQTFEQNPPQRASLPRRSASRQRIVNTRRFQLGYTLGEVGPSGVSSVELFITEDNGRKWWKYGDDPDQKSPFDVEVPRDGIYGFTIRARSGAGLSIGPPLPNEPPEQVVSVDQTAPIVELLPIEQGRGANINKLRVRWKITEDHPTEMPVSLEYAASPSGPWTPITGWREDLNHTFDWMVGPGVPTQFYFRVLVRDSAGNIGKAETQQPIVVDLVQPTARIVDVEVTSGSNPQ